MTFPLVAEDASIVMADGLVRSSCSAPRGMNRFGLGSFREFQFGVRYVPFDGDVILNGSGTNEELVIERKLERPWCSFERVLLYYTKGNRFLYKIEHSKSFAGENSSKEAYGCAQEVVRVCSRCFNSDFRKVVTSAKAADSLGGFSCVYVYENQDETFPVRISVLRKDNIRRMLVSIESKTVAGIAPGGPTEEYRCPELIHRACLGPVGADRFGKTGFGVFLEFHFGQKLTNGNARVVLDVDSNRCHAVSQKMRISYHGCKLAELYYDLKKGRLYKVRMSWLPVNVHNTQDAIAAATDIAKDLCHRYNIKFRKEKYESVGGLVEPGSHVLRWVADGCSFSTSIDAKRAEMGRIRFVVEIRNDLVIQDRLPISNMINDQIEVDI